MEKFVRYNYAAAFLEYLNGTCFAEISSTLEIPYKRLVKRAREERWASLVENLAAPLPETPSPNTERVIERIQENRERNLAAAQGMQGDVLEQVERLRAGTLTTKRQTSTGQTLELPAGIKERVELATYATTVAELSYRALGDNAPGRRGEVGQAASDATITVIVPQVVALPRGQREIEPAAGRVIDV